jgi:alanine dehydrogenase
MIIGLPKEIKMDENRVALTPEAVRTLVQAGHTVYVETRAGVGSGFSDDNYLAVGGQIIQEASEVFRLADIVVKVKEPLAVEFDYFREGLTIFTYLHLAAAPALTQALLSKKVTGIAYETVQLENRSLPLLAPMSQVAGRMSVQVGAHFLEKLHGGKGVLLGGIPTTSPAKVTIIGGGYVGTEAAKMALGMEADVTLLDVSEKRLADLQTQFNGKLHTAISNPDNIARCVAQSDLLIGAVLLPGAAAPKLVTEEMVKTMSPGSVIVDVAIDQGGCIATIDHTTSHHDPVYLRHGVLHYSVPNMPGAVPRTSTEALVHVTLPYLLKLANQGVMEACKNDIPLRLGINTHKGFLTNQGVAEALRLPYESVHSFF